MEFQPGKAFPVPKHAFVKDDGTRIDVVGGQERGFLRFSYKGQGFEYVMMGRLTRPIPSTGDLIFTLEPLPYEPASRAVAARRLRPEDIAKIPRMKREIVCAFRRLPLWLHLEPELASRHIKVQFHPNFDL